MNKSDLGVPLTNIALIILLVDQNISNNTLNECSDISTNANISMFSFRHNLLNVTLEVHTYVITDLNSAVEAVMNYYDHE